MRIVQEARELPVGHGKVGLRHFRGLVRIIHGQAEALELEPGGAILVAEDALDPVRGVAGPRPPVPGVGAFVVAQLVGRASGIDGEPVAVFHGPVPGHVGHRVVRVRATVRRDLWRHGVAFTDALVAIVHDPAAMDEEQLMGFGVHGRVDPDAAQVIEMHVRPARIIGVRLGVVQEAYEFFIRRLEC